MDRCSGQDSHARNRASEVDFAGRQGRGPSPLSCPIEIIGFVFEFVIVFMSSDIIQRIIRCALESLLVISALNPGEVMTSFPLSKLIVDCLPGSAALDHGFARFDHVRIPRKYMFSKFAMVTEDGRYVKPQNPKHSFGGVCLPCINYACVLNSPPDDVYPCEVARSTATVSISNDCS